MIPSAAARARTSAAPRKEIADYIDTYHHRRHSGIGYRAPTEVAATWRPDPTNLQTLAT